MDPREKGPWTYELIVEIFRHICESSTPILVVVDAVDEAENAEVLALIKSAISQANGSKARFIVLSRPEYRLNKRLMKNLPLLSSIKIKAISNES